MAQRAKWVLLVSPGDDIHSLAVMARIRQRYGDSGGWYIFDTATYPLSSSLTFLSGDCASWPVLRISAPLGSSIGVKTDQILIGRSPSEALPNVPLGPETSVWWRRYRRPIPHPDLKTAEFRDYSRQTLKDTLFAALSFCNVHNPMGVEEQADRKGVQLLTAQYCGLNVPRTLISNDPEEIALFADQIGRLGKRLVYKHATATAGFGMSTRVFDGEATGRIAEARYAPTIFQEEITGVDLRVAVIGSEIFCCEWRGTFSGEPFVDIKLAEKLTMYPGRLPDDACGPLLDLHRRLGLTFGICDFKLDESGTPWFLEINPSGQWLDMEIEGGHPISECLARVLVEGNGRVSSSGTPPYTRRDLDCLYSSSVRETAPVWSRVY